MEIGMIGLGRMGANMVRRLLRQQHICVVFDRSPEAVKALVSEKAVGTASLAGFVKKLAKPRAVWLMVPAAAVDGTIADLLPHLSPGDTLIDGGNSYYIDDIRRAKELAARKIHYVDVGTSGGVWGLERGYCMMIGGEKETVDHLDPIFRALAPGVGDIPRTRGREKFKGTAERGYLHCGPNGAGHFVKMVHNGIEYGMMAAYGEGFELLAGSTFDIDLHRVAGLWNRGSVVRSWMLELAERAFDRDPRLESIRGYVEDSGEGRWTVQEALDQDVPLPIITLSLMRRFASRQESSFSAKVQAALRNEFGGHAVKPAESP